jgi:F420-non-reducing hydrogenase large subunit
LDNLFPSMSNASIALTPYPQLAEGLIKKGEVTDDILNMVEMAFRAYDPCYACATHTLPGQMPLDVKIYKSDGTLLHNLRRP